MVRAKKYLDRTLFLISSTILVLLVVGSLWQVFSRYVLNSPNPYTEELLRVGLIWLTMLSASYAFGTNQHLSFFLVRDRLSGRKRQVLETINSVVIMAFVAIVMIKGGIDLSGVTWDENTPILLVPRAVVNVSLPLAGIIILFYQAFHLTDVYRSGTEDHVGTEEAGDMVQGRDSTWM